MTARTLRWGMLLLAIVSILLACKLADQGFTLPLTGATPTLPPTDTPLPSPTSPPSPTPPPTLAPTLPPTDTPLPTQPPAPPTSPAANAPTQGPQNGSETSAHVTITNGLGAAIKIVLNGPTQRSFTIYGLSRREVDLVPGTYSFTITATGYYPLTGTRTFTNGDNVWNIGKE